jgi:peptidoglycan/xylan/chitin deacetylase (PgdA/CDA1 family)
VIERAKIGIDQAHRIGMAVLVGAILTGSAGYTWFDQLTALGSPARAVSRPSLAARSATPAPAPQATATPTVVLSSPVALATSDKASFGVARVAPYLDAVNPTTSEIPVYAPIVMAFSQPMDRPSVEVTFAIRPSVDGRLAWRDDVTLGFEPFRLAYATTYQVDVAGRSTRGVPLSGRRHWTFTTVAGPADVVAPGAGWINVPILMYHYIRINPDRYDRLGFALSVTPADFAAQMDWLQAGGYHPITAGDLYSFLKGARGLPSKPVVLTFDDGYADFYTTALPILRSHDFRATAYVVSGFVGWPGYMTAAQVLEADRSGIEIGSHTVNHVNLTRLSYGAVRSQLVDSKQFLERLVGHPVVSFCYPSGKVNSMVAWQVADVGFANATTTAFGFRHTLSDRYIWTRLRVSGGETRDLFAAAVSRAS